MPPWKRAQLDSHLFSPVCGRALLLRRTAEQGPTTHTGKRKRQAGQDPAALLPVTSFLHRGQSLPAQQQREKPSRLLSPTSWECWHNACAGPDQAGELGSGLRLRHFVDKTWDSEPEHSSDWPFARQAAWQPPGLTRKQSSSTSSITIPAMEAPPGSS